MAIKLHELSTTASPSNDYRFALGKIGVPAENIVVSDFLSWLNGALSFMKPSENLNDVLNKTTARTNLDVYSKGYTDSIIANRAYIYNNTSQPSGALKADNTSPFDPSLSYHPATKKYVDESGGGLLLKGSTVLGDIPAGTTPITVNFADIGTTSYMVVYSIEDSITTSSFSMSIGAKTTSSFDFQIKELSAGVQNVTLRYRLYTL